MDRKIILIAAAVLVIIGVFVVSILLRPPSLPAEAEQTISQYILQTFQGMQSVGPGDPYPNPPAYSLGSAQKASRQYSSVFAGTPDETWCVVIQPPINTKAGGNYGVPVTLAHFVLTRTAALWQAYGADPGAFVTTIGQNGWLSLGCTNW